MFELNTKNLIIAGSVAVAVTAVAVASAWWFTRKTWDAEAGEAVIHSVLDTYNTVIEQYASDNAKAYFAYEIAVSEIRKTFMETNAQFEEELAAWVIRFDTEVATHKKAFGKN